MKWHSNAVDLSFSILKRNTKNGKGISEIRIVVTVHNKIERGRMNIGVGVLLNVGLAREND